MPWPDIREQLVRYSEVVRFGTSAIGLMTAGACAGALAPPIASPACEAPISDAALLAAKQSKPEANRTLQYKGQGGLDHTIFVFEPGPSDTGGVRGGLVLYHGGGWQRGSPEQFYRQARFLTGRGYVVYLPEYGLESDHLTPRDALLDAATAWQAVQADARARGLAPNGLIAGGGSAGGHLAASLLMDTPLHISPVGDRPVGLVLFNPVIDNGPDGYGHDRVKDYWLAFSPLHNISDQHPATLVMLGDADELIPVATAEAYCSAVRGKGASCQLETFTGQKHGWFNDEGFIDTLRSTATFVDRISGLVRSC